MRYRDLQIGNRIRATSSERNGNFQTGEIFTIEHSPILGYTIRNSSGKEIELFLWEAESLPLPFEPVP